MTAVQTREPARTPREAQSAGSHQTGSGLVGLFLIAIGRLCLASAVGLCCAVAYTRGWNPGISLCALFLLWHFIGPRTPSKWWGGDR